MNAHADTAERGQVDRRAGPVAIVDIVRVCQPDIGLAIVEPDDLVCLGHVGWTEEGSVEHQEQGAVEACAQGDRHYDGGAVEPVACHQADAEPQVLQEGGDRGEAALVARPFSERRDVTKRAPCRRVGFARVHALVDERLPTQLDVHPHLVGEVVVQAPAVNERCQPSNPAGHAFPLSINGKP